LIYNTQITTAANAVAYFHPAAAFSAFKLIGAPVVVVLASDGEGLPAGEDSAGDGESAGDGLSPDGDGLSAAAHTLSAVVEPALLSTSVVALHAVQFKQVLWLDAVENFPAGHTSQVRSVLPVPLAAIF
jgi:hypothetical protein